MELGDPTNETAGLLAFRCPSPEAATAMLRDSLLEARWDTVNGGPVPPRDYSQVGEYTLFKVGDWAVVWSNVVDGGDLTAKVLSRHLGPDSPVCCIQKIDAWWRLEAYLAGNLVARHDSQERVIPDWDSLRLIQGRQFGERRIGSATTFGRIFKVAPSVIQPYLVYLSEAERRAILRVNDAVSLSKVQSDDLRDPLDEWFFADLLRRLGVEGINDVLRDKVEPAASLKAYRLTGESSSRLKTYEEASKDLAEAAMEGLFSIEPMRQLESAIAMIEQNPAESLAALARLAQREDAVGALAVRYLGSSADASIMELALPYLSGLPPFEQAAMLRDVGFSRDKRLCRRSALKLVRSPSLLVRLEAIDAIACCRIPEAHAHFKRLVCRGSTPFEVSLARAGLAAVGGGAADIEVSGLPEFLREDIPLRHCTVSVRHPRSLLLGRIQALLWLASIRKTRLEALMRSKKTHTIPYYADVVRLYREAGLTVDEPPVSLREELCRSFVHVWPPDGIEEMPVYKWVELLLRQSSVLGARLEGDGAEARIVLFPTGYGSA